MVRELLTASLLAAPVVASNTPEITVAIFNYSVSSPSAIEEAKAEVSSIYRHAGIVLDWQNCAGLPDLDRAACERPLILTGPMIALRIVSNLTIDPRNAKRDSSNVLGYSTGVYTTISYEQSWRVSAQTGEARAHVLACAIAHELGHVFLGSDSHSHLGLMQRDAKSMLRAVRQGFGFSDSESARLVRSVSSRQPVEGVELSSRFPGN